jgi:hypothetical protein
MSSHVRTRVWAALAALLLVGSACFFDEAPTDLAETNIPAALSVQPALGPLAAVGSAEPINRIRVRATQVPEQVLLSARTVDVDPAADAWAVSLRVPASSDGTSVVVSLDLIHVAGDGTEIVQYTGQSEPVTLVPGFQGTIEVPLLGITGLVGNVYVAETGGGLAGATVQVMEAVGGAVAATLTTDSDGGYQASDMAPGEYRLLASADGFQTGIGFATVLDGFIVTVSPIGLVTETGPGDLSGTVQNAINTSDDIADATVELRAGAGAPDSEPVVASTTTDAFGAFLFAGVDAGNYTIRTVASEYADGHANVVVQAGLATSRLVLMSPGLLSGEIRTVLTWGPSLPEVAADLDSHLTGPHDGLTPLNSTYHVDAVDGGRFHIAYYDPGTFDGPPGAILHNDDTSWEGPETTTIAQVLSGTYRFTVDLYCCTASIRSSQARVEVFDSQGLLAEFNAPNQDGQTWIVFDLVDGQIRPVNRVVAGRNTDTAQHLLAHPTSSGPVGPSTAPSGPGVASHPKSPVR